MPPPVQIGLREEPARARPVPFCFHGLAPPPRTLPRVLVECGAATARSLLGAHGLVHERHVELGLERLGVELDGAASRASLRY